MAGTRGTGISPVQKEYLDVLRSAIWGETPACLPGDIAGVLEIANVQKTRPLILDALQKAGYCDPECMTVIYRTASAHVTINRAIAALVGLLRENGIEPVLFKGQGVALNYPQPMLRECGDIDLYVGPEHYEKACALVRERIPDTARKFKQEADKHYTAVFNDAIVEIHKATFILEERRKDAFYQSFAADGLSRDLVPVTIGEATVNTPADGFNAFYLFLHFLRHAIQGGIGLRQICDWALFLHSRAGKLDTSVVDRALTELGLRDSWRVYASVAVDFLGLPAAEMPFYQAGYEGRAAQMISLILEEGNFGRGIGSMEGRPTDRNAAKLFTARMILRRSRILWRLLPETRPLIPGVAVSTLTSGIGHFIKDLFKK